MLTVTTYALGLTTLLTLSSANDGSRANPVDPSAKGSPRTIRVVDVNGDGQLDRLSIRADGSLAVSLNVGGRRFQDAGQRLPGASVAQVLTGDLNGDGQLDLYLVSPDANVALVGDGLGGFLDETEELGLVDRGDGKSAELTDLDGDGTADLLLHNASSDAIFWGSRLGGFERDENTPEVLPAGGAPLAAPMQSGGATTEESVAGRGSSPGAEPQPGPAPAAPGGPGAPRRIPLGGSPAGGSSSGATAIGVVTTPTGPRTGAPHGLFCADELRDQATGSCGIEASSIPTLGQLFPISTELFVDGATGDVGIGTVEPIVDLHVVGVTDLGSGMIAPGFTGSGRDSELLFAEDDDGTYGMKFLYDGGENALQVFGRTGDADHTDPVFRLDRDTGRARLGGTGIPNAKLHVDGSDNTGIPAIRADGGDYRALQIASSDSGSGTAVITNSRVDGTGAYISGGYEGVYGTTDENIGIGVHGEATTTSSIGDGVWGRANSALGWGVNGVNLDYDDAGGRGVNGSAQGPEGRGVYGVATYSIDTTYGVYGYVTSADGYGVYSAGDFAATGSKSFLQPHPTDPSKEIRFVCMEGNEAVTFFRGSAQLSGGVAVIEVPEEFRLVSLEERLLVQVTPMGPASLWIEHKDLDRIVVRGTADTPFDYFVSGERRGYEDHEPIQENYGFRPEERGVPLGSQYPESYRQILVENGILNPDFTPNEATAVAQGWTLQEPGLREKYYAEHLARIEKVERQRAAQANQTAEQPADDN